MSKKKQVTKEQAWRVTEPALIIKSGKKVYIITERALEKSTKDLLEQERKRLYQFGDFT